MLQAHTAVSLPQGDAHTADSDRTQQVKVQQISFSVYTQGQIVSFFTEIDDVTHTHIHMGNNTGNIQGYGIH